MLYSYPVLSQTIMDSTNIFSIIKSMTTTIYFISLIFILIIFGIKAMKKRKPGVNTL